MIELKHIKYFLAVAETLNFTRAANQNKVSQPALTKSIQSLEKDLGGLLIVRDGKNTRLTKLGEAVIIEFSRIAECEARAHTLARNNLEEESNLLKVGIENSLGPAKLVGFFTEFLTENKKMKIILHQINREAVEEEVLTGRIDVCISTNPFPRNHKIKTALLYKERILLAFAKGKYRENEGIINSKNLSEQYYPDNSNSISHSDPQKMISNRKLSLKFDSEDWKQQIIATNKGCCQLGEFSNLIPGIRLSSPGCEKIQRSISMSYIFGSAAPASIIKLKVWAEKYNWA